jgi:uncharacterized repeat protein (TIGR03837 family)
MVSSRRRWDIFCRVVDNFGDIGICWRLARQLHEEHGLNVRLWVDDLVSTKRLLPEFDMTSPQQTVRGVEIHHWQAEFHFNEVADVVIEAFACELPESYIQAMCSKQPLWLNLEYLSAEQWVEDYHLQPSPHPRLPLKKTFFFPGFTLKTGGLIREQSLLQARDHWQAQASGAKTFWPDCTTTDNTLVMSLFCYPHAPIHQLLDTLTKATTPTLCIVPDSAITPTVSAFFREQTLAPHSVRQSGSLTVKTLPFLSQAGYDELLWSCDLNFVRGEDSWIRAIWASKPFIWLPYHQSEDTHLIKLAAFLKRYQENLDTPGAEALNTFSSTWASERFDPASWQQLTHALPNLSSHAKSRSQWFASQPDLASKLVIFCENFS